MSARPFADRAPGAPNLRAEATAIALPLLASLCALAFVVVVCDLGDTQLLGLSSGSRSSSSRRRSSDCAQGDRHGELEHPYPPQEHLAEQRAIEQLVEGRATADARRALQARPRGRRRPRSARRTRPAVSFGRSHEACTRRRGARARLVDEENGRSGRRTRRRLLHGVSEGADGSSSRAGRRRALPRGAAAAARARATTRTGSSPLEICTHASCAISMYRVPLFAADEPSPALVCPCHYSRSTRPTAGALRSGPQAARCELP